MFELITNCVELVFDDLGFKPDSFSQKQREIMYRTFVLLAEDGMGDELHWIDRISLRTYEALLNS